jgi:hypothetical protein
VIILSTIKFDGQYPNGTRVRVNEDGLRYFREYYDKVDSNTIFVIKELEFFDKYDEEESVYGLAIEGDEFFKNEDMCAYHRELIVVTEELDNQKTDIIDSYFEQRGKDIGALVDSKQKAYGNAVEQTYNVVEQFMKPYLNKDGETYTIPKSLLKHLLLQVRIIDKQNRIFNNPDQDLMEENTYRDISGYGLLGEKFTGR